MTRPPKKIIWADPSDLGRLHCDAIGCGYVAPTPDPWGPELIGKPCPRCGANLLTRGDYDRTERMIRLVDLINRIFGPIFGRRQPPANAQTIAVRMHGHQADIQINPKDGP